MGFIAELLVLAINIYMTVIILQVIVHWLVVFEVFNASSPQAQNLIGLLNRLTDPVMKPVQKFVPPIAGIDITPIVVIIGLELLKYIIVAILA
ncbi:MAG: YggT family protein [Alphaproteobacteria bacterium]|nr:YggT family protein [Alphaproteobacteria bacterium]